MGGKQPDMRETVPHHMPLVEIHGGSPGNGISPASISEDPMAFEEEFFRELDVERRRTDRSLRGGLRAQEGLRARMGDGIRARRPPRSRDPPLVERIEPQGPVARRGEPRLPDGL